MGFFLGTQNEFEIAVVNEPSVFELLTFYCMNTLCCDRIITFHRDMKTDCLNPHCNRFIWGKYVHEVLVNRLGGLSLPRKSVVRLTDRPDMTLDV